MSRSPLSKWAGALGKSLWVRTNLLTWVSLLLLQTPAIAADAPPTKASAAVQEMGVVVLKCGEDGVPVFIDDQPVGVTPLPGPWTLPAGRHEIEVRPKGGAPAKASVEITAGGREEVELLKAVAGVTPKTAEREIEVIYVGAGFPLATAGYVTAGVGVAALATGVVLGLSASGSAEDARNYDRQAPGNDRVGLAAFIDDTEQAAFHANIAYGVGLVTALAGVAMVLLASDGPLSRKPVPVKVVPIHGGAALGGSF